MIEPIKFVHGNVVRWSTGRTGFVEYLLWKRGTPSDARTLRCAAMVEHEYPMSAEILGATLAALVKSRKVVKLLRGVYIHADHAAIFT